MGPKLIVTPTILHDCHTLFVTTSSDYLYSLILHRHQPLCNYSPNSISSYDLHPCLSFHLHSSYVTRIRTSSQAVWSLTLADEDSRVNGFRPSTTSTALAADSTWTSFVKQRTSTATDWRQQERRGGVRHDGDPPRLEKTEIRKTKEKIR